MTNEEAAEILIDLSRTHDYGFSREQIKALGYAAMRIQERPSHPEIARDPCAEELNPNSRVGCEVAWQNMDGSRHSGMLKEWDNGTAIIEERINGVAKEVAVDGGVLRRPTPAPDAVRGRLMAFRSEVLRLCDKYIAFYVDQEMPNTATAFEEVRDLALSADKE